MEPTYLTPTFATCQALQHAGFTQSTLLYWDDSGQAARPSLPDALPKASCRESVSAPLLCEVLPLLPSHLDIALPHPIYNTTKRRHALVISMQGTTTIGYMQVGSPHVFFEVEHANSAEAAARLYLLLVEKRCLDAGSTVTEQFMLSNMAAQPTTWGTSAGSLGTA